MLGGSNSNITMKFVQLHCFYHTILGGQKILCPPMTKSWGDMSPSNSVLACDCHLKKPNNVVFGDLASLRHGTKPLCLILTVLWARDLGRLPGAETPRKCFVPPEKLCWPWFKSFGPSNSSSSGVQSWLRDWRLHITNIFNYDYIESNHDYNSDYICLETSSKRKQTRLHGFIRVCDQRRW